MNRLAEVLDNPRPAVAAVVTGPMSDQSIVDIASTADVIELRADKFPNREYWHLAHQARRLAALPLLLTIRLQSEGGSWSLDESKRFKLFGYLLSIVDGIDVELSSEIAPFITNKAHKQDKVVIGSRHNFNRTPSDAELEVAFLESTKLGADYAKIATSAKTLKEYERLAGFTIRHKDEGVIVVAMDDYGPLSRITLPSLGSRLTYAFTGEAANAAGQMNYQETAGIINKLYPA